MSFLFPASNLAKNVISSRLGNFSFHISIKLTIHPFNHQSIGLSIYSNIHLLKYPSTEYLSI